MGDVTSGVGNGETATEAEIRAEIGTRIAARRHELRLSAKAVAERLRVTRVAITQIETGRNNVTAVTLWKLATLLECKVGDFFPAVPDGHALTKADARKIRQEGGERAAEWARLLFGEPQ